MRSGTSGKIVWKMDPELDKQDRNRSVALWGNPVISVTGYAGHVIATHKETGQAGMLDGTIVALDDQTPEELWRFNVGTGFNAPTMTDVCCVRPSGQASNSLGAVRRNPELRNHSNATVLCVFGL